MVEIVKFLSGSDMLLIIDESGRVIYSKNDKDFGINISKEEYVQNILSKDQGQFSSSIEGNRHLITFAKLNKGGLIRCFLLK